MANETAAPEAAEQAERLPVPAVSGDVLTEYDAMIADVPDAGGAGVEAILAQIAGATDAADLDAPWRTGGLQAYVDVPIVVTLIRKMPSDFASGLAWFLVIDGAVRATGETFTVTSGSLAVVAQLVKAWALGALPLHCVPRLAKRPTREGYFPMHLEVIRAS